MQNFTEVSVHGVRVTPAFIVQVAGEREGFDTAVHASLFVSFTGRGEGSRGITIYSTFGKRPAPGAGAHQKKFDFAICLLTVADGCDYPAFHWVIPQLRLPQ